MKNNDLLYFNKKTNKYSKNIHNSCSFNKKYYDFEILEITKNYINTSTGTIIWYIKDNYFYKYSQNVILIYKLNISNIRNKFSYSYLYNIILIYF